MTDNRTLRRTRPWMRLVGPPVAAVALLGLAACGTSTATGTSAAAASASAEVPADGTDGTDGTGGTGGTAGQGGAADTDLAAYRSCLEENGVTMPERPAGGAGQGAPAQGDTPPSGAPAPGGRGGQAGPGGTPGQAPPGVDADTWEAAQEACSDLAPTPPDGAPTASANS